MRTNPNVWPGEWNDSIHGNTRDRSWVTSCAGWIRLRSAPCVYQVIRHTSCPPVGAKLAGCDPILRPLKIRFGRLMGNTCCFSATEMRSYRGKGKKASTGESRRSIPARQSRLERSRSPQRRISPGLSKSSAGCCSLPCGCPTAMGWSSQRGSAIVRTCGASRFRRKHSRRPALPSG